MQSIRCKAIVLRRTNYAESDRVIDCITPDGLVSVIAKGVRKEKSKLAGGIELFSVCDIVIGLSRGNLKILVSSRIVNYFGDILKDFDRMQFAYEVLFQIKKASVALNGPEWFQIASEILFCLNNKAVSLQLIQTWFYIQISQLLGEELNTRTDHEGSPLDQNKSYRYDAQEKSFIADINGPIKNGHIKIMRLCAAKPILSIHQIGGMQEYLDECYATSRQHASLKSS